MIKVFIRGNRESSVVYIDRPELRTLEKLLEL